MVDVCLILEGTYPYITGGVSNWIQSLITGLPELNFAIIHMYVDHNHTRQARYSLPPNLVQLVEWPLNIEADGKLVTLSAPLPPARIYHALSTGFAGMLGCQIKTTAKRPLILTEHGIYWREVEAGADELECGFQLVPTGQDGLNLQPLRYHWTIKFQEMARQTYQYAEAITTVCQANNQWQTTLGAPAAKCQVIPNSVNWQALAPKSARLPATNGSYRIGFVGRVVSIKDVLTFLAACQQVADELPRSKFYIIGPVDHDPAYVARCRAFVTELGLEQRVAFIGETDPTPWYQKLDIVALTSVSEGQPLVLLEAMAAGVPIIATEVGGCPELILGSTAQDQALGQAGLLTPVGDPRATATAMLKLCRNADLWGQTSQTGQERVRRFYSTERLCRAYHNLYQQWL